MAKGVNKVILLGNIGRDPEIRTLPGGTLVANLSLATSEFTKDKSGNRQERTEWHRCVAFGRTAEIIRDYAAKGSRAFIEGRLQTSSWDDKESGQKRYQTEIIIMLLQLIDFKRDGAQHSHREDDEQRSTVYDTHGRHVADEDIPF